MCVSALNTLLLDVRNRCHSLRSFLFPGIFFINHYRTVLCLECPLVSALLSSCPFYSIIYEVSDVIPICMHIA
jgi:hypothetical protein